MKPLFQILVKDRKPLVSGWYHTDKGSLYFFREEGEFSCRDDRLSEEYPKYWYTSEPPPELAKVLEKIKDQIPGEGITTANFKFIQLLINEGETLLTILTGE